ncbi:potassium channel protein [Halostagnicola larsenii XH-48]|uniref:Potassium channel protein n=1 Tax=Halostagnicola larsenii XH-48 TaxID=797299 RepID=W0JMW5_9EURY|nr:NAD-binding protein [Halostagnicola larsenii]AHF99933.1 potassium channel protein [Halostagnicola larsenii XH-48]
MLERVRAHRPRGRVAVWIVTAIALLSIATGVIAIVTEPTVQTGGFWGDLQAVSEFSGTVLGFALLVSAWGMYRGFRLAYVVAAALVLLAAVHGVAQSRLLSIPLVVLSLGGLVVLVLTSDRFTRSTSLTATQIGSMIAIIGVFSYGTAGAYALRAGFAELETVLDAVYFTFVTASTVGYGDVHPLTQGARLFAVSLIVLGPTTVGLTVGSLIGPEIESRLSRTGRRAKELDRTDGRERIAVLGYDGLTESLVDGLEKHADVCVVSDDQTVTGRLESRTVDVVVGDPADEETLRQAQVDAANAVLVATADDARNTYAVLAARELTDARIVVCTETGNRDALEKAGADVVVDPGKLLTNAIVGTAAGSSQGRDHSAASTADQSG